MKRRPPKSTHLYVLSCNNLLKIGVTNDINQRIKTLQTGNPFEIKLEYLEERFNPCKAEHYLHQTFQDHQVNGEWFSGISILDIRRKLLMFHDQECEPDYF